jgi:hypothetical protein
MLFPFVVDVFESSLKSAVATTVKLDTVRKQCKYIFLSETRKVIEVYMNYHGIVIYKVLSLA